VLAKSEPSDITVGWPDAYRTAFTSVIGGRDGLFLLVICVGSVGCFIWRWGCDISNTDKRRLFRVRALQGREFADDGCPNRPSFATVDERADTVSESEDAQPGLHMISVSKRFGPVWALKDVSLFVMSGEIVGLFGRDGAGKTVCFEAIMGLASINSGRILLNGQDVSRLTIDRRAPLGLSFLSQETSIFREMTTAENIAAVLELHEPDTQSRKARLEYLLSSFNIDYVRDTPALRLSGGERRRCEVARAMASTPTIMLFDEPFAGIDPMTVVSISKVISSLRKQGVGVLISDQNVHTMIELIDRAYVLHEGEIVFQGTPEAMNSDEYVHSVYLGHKSARS
jgi:lipopolysaccharide export system ATP-binding protein